MSLRKFLGDGGDLVQRNQRMSGPRLKDAVVVAREPVDPTDDCNASSPVTLTSELIATSSLGRPRAMVPSGSTRSAEVSGRL